MLMQNKNTLKFLFSCLFLLLFVFSSCQKPSAEENYSTTETIINTSPLCVLLKRVAMQKTSQDNLIDKSSCFMIKFPYEVEVNNSEIYLYSSNDYKLVQNNINASSTDSDIVKIDFPVKVVLSDYSERYLTNQTAFNNLIVECQENSNDFGKINCLSFNYPFTINLYNSNNQIASSIEIANNKSLYEYTEYIGTNQYISISYPINIVNQNAQTITVTSNNQLEDIIYEAIENCSENPLPTQSLTQVITNGSWKISYYFNDNEKTPIYSGYNFIFKSDFKATANKSGVIQNGNWKTFIDGSKTRFEIKFSPNPLNEINEDWKVFEYNETQLRFCKSEIGYETDYLYFTKN
jgi:hypothetical protein